MSRGEPGSGSPSRTHVAWPATISTSVILTALGKGTMDVRECGGCCHKGACQEGEVTGVERGWVSWA